MSGIILESAEKAAIDRPTERAMIRAILGLYEVASEHKERRTGMWKKSYEMIRGRQWEPRPSWRASPVANLVYSKMEHLVAVITDSRPNAHLQPRFPEIKEYADAMQRLHDYEWKKDDMQQTVEDVTKSMCLWSVGIYHTYWDKVEKRPKTECVDPHRCYIDPRATDIDNSRYFLRVASYSRAEIERKWPKARSRRDDMKPGAILIETESDREQNAGDGEAYRGSYSGGAPVELVPRQYDLVPGDENEFQVLDLWIRDATTLETVIDIEDPDTGEKIPIRAPKYPAGRHIVIAGGVLVYDEPNEYEHEEFPYVAQFCVRVPNEFWCMSYVEQLIEPQKMVNKLYGIAMENAAKMANSQWLVPSGSIKDPKTSLTGEAGLVVEYTPHPVQGNKPERIEGAPIPAFLIQMMQMARSDLDDISGQHDVTQGRKPTGITAGVAIESLQEAGQTRVRPLVRHLERAIEKVSEQRLALLQQYSTEAREFRVTDEASGESVYVKLTPDMIRQQYDIEVVAGSTLPKSRDQRQREAVALKELGVFDEQAVLEYVEHPGRERILKRIKERRAQAMEIALRTGMPPGQVDPGAYSNAEANEMSSMGGPQEVALEGPPPARRPQVEGRGGGFFNQENA